MHEMAIASALMDQLLRIAAENRATRISEVEVRCGVMRQVAPDALQLAYEALSDGTPAAGARLTVVEEGLVARCRTCNRPFAAAVDSFLCPDCGRADVEIVAGDDIVLQSVVCETERQAAAT